MIQPLPTFFFWQIKLANAIIRGAREMKRARETAFKLKIIEYHKMSTLFDR